MKLEFIGAAHEVTGSCHFIHWQDKSILVDCGMEQGPDIYENQELPVQASEIDYVFVTHAHIDHSGLLPLLAQKGFQGQIFATDATTQLCQIMLKDSAHIQEFEAEWKSWLHSPAASGRASLAAGTAAAAETAAVANGTAAVASGRAAVAEEIAPQRVFIRQIDITASDAPERLLGLVEEMGGMDMYIHSSGIGYKNMALDGRIERETVITNALGFTQMVDAAFDWFKERSGGHIAFISSVAGTKGLGAAPSYSATKRYQWIYAQALAQLSSMERYNISFTDIRPGFVATGFLGSSKYPLLLEKHYVAQKIVKAILARKRSVIIDYKYKILCLFWRMIPNWLWERLTNIKS